MGSVQEPHRASSFLPPCGDAARSLQPEKVLPDHGRTLQHLRTVCFIGYLVYSILLEQPKGTKTYSRIG